MSPAHTPGQASQLDAIPVNPHHRQPEVKLYTLALSNALQRESIEILSNLSKVQAALNTGLQSLQVAATGSSLERLVPGNLNIHQVVDNGIDRIIDPQFREIRHFYVAYYFHDFQERKSQLISSILSDIQSICSNLKQLDLRNDSLLKIRTRREGLTITVENATAKIQDTESQLALLPEGDQQRDVLRTKLESLNRSRDKLERRIPGASVESLLLQQRDNQTSEIVGQISDLNNKMGTLLQSFTLVPREFAEIALDLVRDPRFTPSIKETTSQIARQFIVTRVARTAVDNQFKLLRTAPVEATNLNPILRRWDVQDPYTYAQQINSSGKQVDMVSNNSAVAPIMHFHCAMFLQVIPPQNRELTTEIAREITALISEKTKSSNRSKLSPFENNYWRVAKAAFVIVANFPEEQAPSIVEALANKGK